MTFAGFRYKYVTARFEIYDNSSEPFGIAGLNAYFSLIREYFFFKMQLDPMRYGNKLERKLIKQISKIEKSCAQLLEEHKISQDAYNFFTYLAKMPTLKHSKNNARFLWSLCYGMHKIEDFESLVLGRKTDKTKEAYEKAKSYHDTYTHPYVTGKKRFTPEVTEVYKLSFCMLQNVE